MAGPGRSKLAETARLKLAKAPHSRTPFSHINGKRPRSSSPVSPWLTAPMAMPMRRAAIRSPTMAKIATRWVSR